MSMDPEAPTQAAPDTPAPAATPEIPWQKRYEDLRPEFDRSTHTLSDEDALLKHIGEKFPHLLAEEAEPEPEPEPETTEQPDLAALRKELAEIKAAQETSGKTLEEINAERALKAFDADLKQAAGDREVSSIARDWISQRTAATGNNPEALAKATKEWFAEEDRLQEAARKPRPRAPHVPAGGQAATGGKQFKDMTDQEALAYQVDRFNAELA